MKNFTKNLQSKTLFLCLAMFVLLACYTPKANAQALDSKGQDFWLMFNQNISSPALTLFIASDVNTSGTVSIPGLGFSESFTVTANNITSVVIPVDAGSHTSGVIDDKGIHVTALKEVTVYGLNYAQYTTDAYLGIPTDALGEEYIIMSYQGNSLSEFGVVATQNATAVTITPSIDVSGHAAGAPYNITLQKGETYELGGGSDFTGTLITSNKPVGVMGANACANIPPGYGYCDHINEMLPPVSTWGQKFVTVPLKSRASGDTWRFLASQNNTVVKINGVAQPEIDKGEFLEKIITEQSVIESNNPILVAQFANGSDFSGNPGDPFMMLIPPFEQFLGKYTVTTVSGYVAHFINVVAPNAIVGSLTLDGAVVPASEFTAIGSSGFSGAQLEVEPGVHNLFGTRAFGVFQYGFNQDDSYGYPGGQAYGKIVIDTKFNLSLTPQSGTGSVGNEQCFNALLKDELDNPAIGVRIDFTIKGVNSESTGFAFTNASGVAEFCYTGENAGLDSIIASFSDLADTSTFTWSSSNTCKLNITYTVDSVDCKGGDNGAIDLEVDGGTGPYKYDWSNGETTEDISGLQAGTYSVTVTDDKECKQTIKVVIWEPNELKASSEAGIILCKGGTTTVTVTATGGTKPYTGAGTFTVNAGAYSFTVTDANGCTSTTEGTVEESSNEDCSSYVILVKPLNDAVYYAPAIINIRAIGHVAGGTIKKIEFYSGTTLIRTENYPQYAWNWKDVPVGDYILTAKLYDENGLVATSAPVHITVVENQPPTIVITSPVDGATFSKHESFLLKADAHDPDGTVETVDFYHGTTLIFTEYASPYSRRWHQHLAPGHYVLTAVATDNHGLTATSAPVHITIVGNEVPTVVITSPVDDASFSKHESLRLSAEVNDPDGKIKTLSFYHGSTLIFTEYQKPFVRRWHQHLMPGVYVLTAVAEDKDGNHYTSAPVTITITSPDVVLGRPSPGNVLSDVNAAVTLRLTPNPAKSILNISTTGLQNDKQATISVISVSGAVMKTLRTTSSNKMIPLDVSSLVNGVYTIRIISGDKVMYKQFMKM